MKKALYTQFALLLAISVLLSACGQAKTPAAVEPQPAATEAKSVATEAPKPADEAVTLTLWSRDSDQALVEALAKSWNATHKNQIETTIIPADQFVTKVGTAIAGGAAPDLIAIDLVYTPQFAAAGQLTDITDLAKKMPYYASLSPAHMALGTYESKNYALPFSAEASVLVWNKGLYKKAGLDTEKAPASWNEIYENAKKITALGDGVYGYYFSGSCPGCNAFTFAPLIWATGGDILSADYSKPTLTDPSVKAALEFYNKMWTEGLIPPGAKVDSGTDFFNAFQTDKIGMIGSGAFAISVLKKDHPEIDFGVTYLPGQEGGKGSFAGGDNIAIPSGSQHVEQAFEFIQWVLSDDIQLEQYAKNNQLPVRTDLAKNKYFDADPRLTVSANAMALGKTPYSLHYNELFNDSNGPWLAMLQGAIFDGKVDEAIAKAQEQFSSIMK